MTFFLTNSIVLPLCSFLNSHFRTQSTGDRTASADENEDGHGDSCLEKRTSDEDYAESSYSESSEDERVPKAPRYFHFSNSSIQITSICSSSWSSLYFWVTSGPVPLWFSLYHHRHNQHYICIVVSSCCYACDAVMRICSTFVNIVTNHIITNESRLTFICEWACSIREWVVVMLVKTEI